MLDPNAIFTIFFTDVLVSADMQDPEFAAAITALPVAVKSELKTVVYKALDAALSDVVIGGTMGERLKNSRHLFDNTLYNKLWGAHKMRNALVHESGYEPPHHMITRGVDDIKRGLKSLGVSLK